MTHDLMFAREAVLFANDAFYRAFADSDLPAMDALWARDTPVTCIHPGWRTLKTREHIMDVWSRVFANENPSAVTCRAPEVFVRGEVAFVICYEQLPDALLVATNIFHREDGQWRMVHHQSGPTPAHPSEFSFAETGPQLAH